MGLFKLLFGLGTPIRDVRKKSLKNDLPRNIAELRQKTEEFREENEVWGLEFNKLTSLRKKAQEFEKENRFNEAIQLYLESIKIGENSKILKFNNYSFDIDRVIILLSRTKEISSLKAFLNEKVEKYPNAKESVKWKLRLNKIEN